MNAWPSSIPIRRPCRQAAGIHQAAGVRTRHHHPDGFPGYFLIVADFINWAKNNNVPVGPGRGSGAGSLVAYSLRITDLDPLATTCCSSASSTRAGVDARLRYRLLPGRARPRDPVREGQVRPRRGVADRHLRHAGVEIGHPRRPAACSTCPTPTATSSPKWCRWKA